MSNKIEREIIKRRGKFPHVPGLDQEFDNLISQINKKEPTTIINNNVNEGVEIDDTQEFGVTDKTYSSFKINDELSNHPLIDEYYEAVAVNVLEVEGGQEGVVSTDRNVTVIWEELRNKTPDWFEDRWTWKGMPDENGNEIDVLLTPTMAKRIMDYMVFFYVTFKDRPPVMKIPGDPTDYGTNEGWFFAGYYDCNRAIIKCPIGAKVAVWVGFRQKTTISMIKHRIYQYKN